MLIMNIFKKKFAKIYISQYFYNAQRFSKIEIAQFHYIYINKNLTEGTSRLWGFSALLLAFSKDIFKLEYLHV
ncbi:hypothetical protein T07_13037 [Trichinella nelsoni]|uniref:Uncharacterized protein n=1 Tax=Trichinella nelsoni TaxID=6336 RepID=A0A0V0SGZ8_9BILA|nr:hypothetical protein T07_13037 [Trichinella nelsoni]